MQVRGCVYSVFWDIVVMERYLHSPPCTPFFFLSQWAHIERPWKQSVSWSSCTYLYNPSHSTDTQSPDRYRISIDRELGTPILIKPRRGTRPPRGGHYLPHAPIEANNHPRPSRPFQPLPSLPRSALHQSEQRAPSLHPNPKESIPRVRSSAGWAGVGGRGAALVRCLCVCMHACGAHPDWVAVRSRLEKGGWERGRCGVGAPFS